MRYLIISDIHSNLEALKEFIKFIPRMKADKIICLGDIVGYNANPNEVIKVLSQLNNIEYIRGNHDRAVGFNDYKNFSYNASEAVRWTRKKLNYNEESFIKSRSKFLCDIS